MAAHALHRNAGVALGLRLVLATAAAALAALLLPTVNNLPETAVTIVLLRGLVAGCVAGLTFTDDGLYWRPVAAVAGTLVAAIGATILGQAPLPPAGLILGLLVSAGVALALAWFAAMPRAAAWTQVTAVMLILLVGGWYAGLIPGPIRSSSWQPRLQELAAPRVPERYDYDGDGFLRVYELMKQGKPYYESFRQAQTEDARHDAGFIQSIFNYREPLVFLLWRFLPGSNGSHLLMWLLVSRAVLMMCGYWIASRLVQPGPALLAAIAVIPSATFFTWLSTAFTLTEIWAAVFAVAALMCLVRRQTIASLVLLTLAVGAREFYVLLIPAWLIAWVFDHPTRRTSWVPAAAVLGPAAILLAHFVAAPSVPASVGQGLGRWFNSGWTPMTAALEFGYQPSPISAFIALAMPLMAIAAAALVRRTWLRWSLLYVCLSSIAFLFFFGTGLDSVYWGACFTAIFSSIAPGVLGRVFPVASPAAVSQPEVIAEAA